jgi:dihydroorotase-like cyclic amidohydrolase
MFDLIVTGGQAVMPSGSTEPADIGVSGGRIAAIGGTGTLAEIGAARLVDAAGQIVMPGGVDPHIHCSWPIPFPGRNEGLLSAPPDSRKRRVIRKEDLHETDYTPWEGHEVAAWPSMTILRGKIVVENGQFHASLSDGQFLSRKIPDEIRARPAL